MIMRDDSRPKYSSAGRSFTVISPWPGRMRTRATEVLRLPVPQNTLPSRFISALTLALAAARPSHQRHGLLCLVRVVWPRVHLELGGEPATQAILREHPLDRLAHEPGRMPIEDLLRARPPDAARVPGVAHVGLIAELLPGEPDALRVHHDHEVAGIDVGREARVVLAPEHARDACR